MNRILTRDHIRREHVIAAERATPDRIRDLRVAAGQRPSGAARDTAENSVNQLGGQVEHVADYGSRTHADAFQLTP
jgi:hypothetical protein